ncbi:MAG: triphosphoribosyl-dephospho-CoA synthase [Bacillota bacterium]
MTKQLLFPTIEIDPVSWKIGEAITTGILLEVCSHPSPGLVSCKGSGSHKDMNIITFMLSTPAITPTIFMCAQSGRNHGGALEDLLIEIRKIGLVGEDKLLKATKGINTQRGILFLGGLTAAAAGYISKSAQKLTAYSIASTVSQIAKGIINRELNVLKNSKKKTMTAGERLFLKYNVTGIRGEVENGLPSVLEVGFPALEEAITKDMNLNLCLVHTLISLMSMVEDTTILWRKDMATLIEVQEKAKKILAMGSVFTTKGLKEIYKLNREFINNNISPGGSADLVAITAALYLLENERFNVLLK